MLSASRSDWNLVPGSSVTPFDGVADIQLQSVPESFDVSGVLDSPAAIVTLVNGHDRWTSATSGCAGPAGTDFNILIAADGWPNPFC
ncbi:hypothetical protein M2152_000929 [Microbacteriaceae bacterium SG_E_30_P1]|uniref:Uncharacterized protein n=1 Tax=Antiquaquibacter oligotrophicus TaxID=2880260 RepID=A0ABT6KNT8_9MICO|nr:hypothetical protein [Antiquaquibacter oligotrophicus]MDH6180747.1 hypothetical protein [Antiquaquibacter oligotrophicus]UDF13529.1 hypothetical protein LH407_01350 [Antiquaquibacter oligotrophicus]